ncbi:hypothetical protein [Aquimarina muelleri]|uniref:Secreted protein n=1 Tax=Aquimarina muelleri TaxID=279356 RepID=A0A918N2I8_9FLAO|nr:hypothetical protein [Aquimarina muelleri]MCX2765057.1 hypothetical protein [Aquimarina muelleri]GGX19099.1 hypothetical protein GCM10007384_20550 [Aquimarina muelleri]
MKIKPFFLAFLFIFLTNSFIACTGETVDEEIDYEYAIDKEIVPSTGDKEDGEDSN